jgi:Homing endonuclease associated repeat
MSDEHPDLYELAHRTLDAVITAPDAVIGNLEQDEQEPDDPWCELLDPWLLDEPGTSYSEQLSFPLEQLSEHRGVAGRAAGQGDEMPRPICLTYGQTELQKGHEAMSTTVMQQGSMSRAQKIANAQELRAQGLVFREIAAEMGVAVSTVGDWLNDPDGSRSRARKHSYAGSCVDCGASTSGSNGREHAPKRCRNCSVRFRHETAKWTRVTIVQALREFATRYGRSPAAADFSPHQARKLGHSDRVNRFYADGCYPYATQVQNVFGSWNAAIKAAGLIPTEIGRYDRHRAQPPAVTTNLPPC